jgi:hypothetical protein
MLKNGEFIEGIWQRVEILEKEELEKAEVLQRDRELRRKQQHIFLSFTLVLIAICTVSIFIPLDTALVSVISITILILSIRLEFKEMKNSIKAY